MRRPALVLLVVLAVPALALAGNTDPRQKLNPGDERKAASIVFKRTDFTAGWKKTTAPNDDDDLKCAYYNPNGSDLTLTGDAEADFEHGAGLGALYSYSDVYATARDASASWTRTVKPAAVRCFAELFQREAVQDPSTKVAVQKQGAIAFPKLAPRTAAFRIVLQLSLTQNGQTQTVPLTLHLVVVGRGRAEAGFLTVAPAAGVPIADLKAFAKLMAGRMKAAGF